MNGLCVALLLLGGADEDPYVHMIAATEPRIRAMAAIWGRSIEIRYVHTVASGEIADGDHDYAVDYRPTALTWIDGGLLCVGGPGLTTNDTFLEVWSFDDPALLPAPDARSGSAIRADNRTGVVRLYEADVFGREGVWGIVALRGRKTPTALVQFQDSHDVFAVDLTTGAMTLAASPVSSGAPLLDSRLAADWRSYEVRTHRTLGHVYVLRLGGCAEPDDPEGTLLLLFDLDRDGVLDHSGGYREWVEKRMSHPGGWEG